MKQGKSQVSAQRVERAIKFRFNPLGQLTPSYLVQAHNEFKSGYLRNAALLWDEIEDTDDILKSVASKRKKSVARHGVVVEPVDKTRRAKDHQATLEKFWANITTYSALDDNERGGLPLLIRQMMDSVGKRYAVHEKLWRYRGGIFTADFKFVPLWFFENTTGALRYLESDTSLSGVPLDRSAWMITTGDGVMRAGAVAYMFKHLSAQDWLIFCEKYGFPIIHAKCEGKPGDEEWEQMEDAVEDASGGDSIVTSMNSELDAIDFKSGGELPWEKMIDRMDRAMTILWRGGDLSTQSNDNAIGASLQDEEKDALEEDDAANITDVFQEQVDRWVIRYVHGDAEPLAWSYVKGANRQDVELDLKIDEGLSTIGYEDDITALADRYGRPKLRKKSQVVTAPGLPPVDVANEDAGSQAGYLDQASRLYSEAMAADMRPLAEKIAVLIGTASDDELEGELQKLMEEFPELSEKVFSAGAMQEALEASQAAGLELGLKDAEATK